MDPSGPATRINIKTARNEHDAPKKWARRSISPLFAIRILLFILPPAELRRIQPANTIPRIVNSQGRSPRSSFSSCTSVLEEPDNIVTLEEATEEVSEPPNLKRVGRWLCYSWALLLYLPPAVNIIFCDHPTSSSVHLFLSLSHFHECLLIQLVVLF